MGYPHNLPNLNYPDFFDLDDPGNAGLPQGEWLLLLKKAL
jgi:hypothetical protein